MNLSEPIERVLRLEGRELDAEVAREVMGWKLQRIQDSWELLHDEFIPLSADPDDNYWYDLSSEERAWQHLSPKYSDDENCTALVRSELQRRGLMARFTKILMAVVKNESPEWVSATMKAKVWFEVLQVEKVADLLLATPTDTCRAALLAVMGEKGEENGR